MNKSLYIIGFVWNRTPEKEEGEEKERKEEREEMEKKLSWI